MDGIKTVDNLYLDMNGIIHNCSHSDDSNDSAFSQLSENDMFGKVLQYIDHIFSVVMPRKLLYLAIDGTTWLKTQIRPLALGLAGISLFNDLWPVMLTLPLEFVPLCKL